MEKILVLVLLVVINVQLVVTTCSSETASACNEGYNVCVTAAGGGFNLNCDCYGAYTKCLIKNDCISNESFQSLVNSCQSDLGCTLQQCSNGDVKEVAGRTTVEVPSSDSTPDSTPTAPTSSGCNSQVYTCTLGYTACIDAAGTNIDALCSCYGPYYRCFLDVECMTPSQYQSVIQTCSQSGCTLQQCTGNGTVAPVAAAPIQIETPSSASNQCDLQSAPASVCVNEYQSCVLSADISAICRCFSPYISCLFNVDCLSLTQYQSIIRICLQSGCTVPQCTVNGTIFAPVTAPTGINLPSTPIAAPSSASIGPTPASAAMVAVVVYLLHGRSSIKKTNKYV